MKLKCLPASNGKRVQLCPLGVSGKWLKSRCVAIHQPDDWGLSGGGRYWQVLSLASPGRCSHLLLILLIIINHWPYIPNGRYTEYAARYHWPIVLLLTRLRCRTVRNECLLIQCRFLVTQPAIYETDSLLAPKDTMPIQIVTAWDTTGRAAGL